MRSKNWEVLVVAVDSSSWIITQICSKILTCYLIGTMCHLDKSLCGDSFIHWPTYSFSPGCVADTGSGPVRLGKTPPPSRRLLPKETDISQRHTQMPVSCGFPAVVGVPHWYPPSRLPVSASFCWAACLPVSSLPMGYPLAELLYWVPMTLAPGPPST